MLESIHAFGDLIVYPAVVGVLFKFVLINDFLGEYAEFDSCILWPIKRSVEVEVGEICCHVLGPWSGEGAVDDQLDCFKGPRLGSTIVGI